VSGGESGISDLEVQQIIDILDAQPAGVAIGVGGGKLGVKADIGAVWVVEEFAVDAEFRVWPDLLDKEALPPARVGDYRIRCEPLRLQGEHCPKGGFPPNHFGFEVSHPRVHPWGGTARHCVGDHPYTLPGRLGAFLQGERHHSVPLGGQRRGQVLELAGEVLMEEKQVHG